MFKLWESGMDEFNAVYNLTNGDTMEAQGWNMLAPQLIRLHYLLE